MNNKLNGYEIQALIDLVEERELDTFWDIVLGKLYQLLQETQMMEWNI